MVCFRGNIRTQNDGTVSHASRLVSVGLVSVLALAGCMGESDSSNSSRAGDGGPHSSACNGNDVVNLHEDELSDVTVNLPDCFGGNHSSIETGKHLSDAHYSNGRVAFTVAEVDRPSQDAIQFRGASGETLLTINVAIRNLSGQSIERKAKHLKGQNESLLALEEDRELYHYLLEVAYLNEEIDWPEKQSYLAEWTPEDGSHFEQLRQRLQDSDDVLERYRNGKAGERELGRATSRAVQALPRHGQFGMEQLRDLASELDTPIPNVHDGTLTYRSDAERVSRRVGNRSYGDFTAEGTWQFDRRYEFINDVVTGEKES